MRRFLAQLNTEMQRIGTFETEVAKIVNRDTAYRAEVYHFVMEALRFTQHRLKRQGHVTGAELLEGIKEYGLEQFGPMTRTVFEHWGVKNTGDFGKIVFNMVKSRIIATTPTDSLDDFTDVYDFEEVFGKC